MKRVVVLAILAFAATANAGPKSIMVLKAEGTADAATRSAVDASVLKLAKNIDGKVEMGDITLTDAAAMVGCDPAQPACKDDVLSTLGVDEVVATTATAQPTGTNVTVRRLAKGGAPRAAQSIQPAGKPSDQKLAQDLGALFGVAVMAPTTPAKTTPTTTTTPTTPAKTTTTTPPTTPTTPTTATTTNPTHVATATTTASPPPTNPVYDAPFPPATPDHPATAQATPVEPISAAPNGQIVGGKDEDHRSYTWQKVGMGVGGGLVVLSFVLWAKAADTQQQIDEAPKNTPADFKKLTQLESNADGQAGGGNLFFVGGLLLAGISGYSYWHGHHTHHSQSAQIVPTVNPHGAGIAITFGGGL